MSAAYMVHQSQRQAPEWITVRRLTRNRGYELSVVPLADASDGYRQRIRVRYVSNETFIRSLGRTMFRRPTTFRAEWDGQQTPVVATPTGRFNVVHIQAGDAVGIISLGGDEQEPTTSAAMGEALAAIVLITAIAAVTIGGIVLVKLSDDEGSGEAEAETSDRSEDGEGEGSGGEEGGGEQGGGDNG